MVSRLPPPQTPSAKFDPTELAKRALSIISQMHELRRPYVIPDEQSLSRVIENVFWSSLDRYERIPLKARIFFAPIAALTGAEYIIRLANPVPVSKESIRNLAPAHPPDGGLLAMRDSVGTLRFEAILGSYPFAGGRAQPSWLCVESKDVGSFRISHRSEPILEFTRGYVKQLGGMSLDRTTAEALIMGAMSPTTRASDRAWPIAQMLMDIGEAIDSLGHGGALWIVPSDTPVPADLRDLGQRIEMGSSWWTAYEQLWDLRTLSTRVASSLTVPDMELQYAAQEWDLARREALTRSVANLSAVDGAILVTTSPSVVAFNVIGHFVNAKRVLRPTDPSDLSKREEVPPSDFGGSRHRSAINFCASHSPASAIVASHDGGITVFASTEEGVVTGTRVSMIRSDAEVRGADSH